MIEVGGAPRRLRALRLARHAARAGAGQPRPAPARPLRRAAAARELCGAGPAGAGAARADVADARVPRARAAVRRRGLRRGRAGRVRARVSAGRPGIFVAARPQSEPGWEVPRRVPGRAAPRLRVEPGGGPQPAGDAAAPPRRRHRRDGALPTSRRSADLLVPPAAARPAARVRARARRRAGALDPRRNGPGAQEARAALGSRYVSPDPATP